MKVGIVQVSYWYPLPLKWLEQAGHEIVDLRGRSVDEIKAGCDIAVLWMEALGCNIPLANTLHEAGVPLLTNGDDSVLKPYLVETGRWLTDPTEARTGNIVKVIDHPLLSGCPDIIVPSFLAGGRWGTTSVTPEATILAIDDRWKTTEIICLEGAPRWVDFHPNANPPQVFMENCVKWLPSWWKRNRTKVLIGGAIGVPVIAGITIMATRKK